MTVGIRTRAMLGIAAILAMAAAACSSASAGSAAGGSSQGATTVQIRLTEFAISPETVNAPAGRPIAFDVTNDGTADHTFAVQVGSELYETPPIAAGASATLEVDALDPGTYRTSCTVAGHADLGMQGQLVVGDAVAAGTGSDQGAMGGMDMSGASPSAVGAAMSAEMMAQMHQESTDAFPAETEGSGNRILRPMLQDGVKVFELTATELKWEIAPGQFKEAMAYNGQIPGPELRVRPGDRVRLVVQNQMSQPTTVHFHGLTVPNAMDGVPYITQDPIMPGGYFTYEFTIEDPPGMYVYHSHFNSTEQVGKGLYGALIVEPKDGDWASVYGHHVDTEFTLFTGDGPLGYVVNGKSFPATWPIVARRGDWVLIHLANDGAQLHPMHLHGFHFEVVGQDGFPLAQPYMADTLVVAPGQRFDVLVHAEYPGVWAFHCHILPHVEGPEGMFGMVTALVVEEPKG